MRVKEWAGRLLPGGHGSNCPHISKFVGAGKITEGFLVMVVGSVPTNTSLPLKKNRKGKSVCPRR
jgi:hypothetical protein